MYVLPRENVYAPFRVAHETFKKKSNKRIYKALIISIVAILIMAGLAVGLPFIFLHTSNDDGTL